MAGRIPMTQTKPRECTPRAQPSSIGWLMRSSDYKNGSPNSRRPSLRATIFSLLRRTNCATQSLRSLDRSTGCSGWSPRIHSRPTRIRSTVGLTEQLVRLFIKRATILLDVSRMTSGKLKLRVDDFDVGELVRRVVKAHEPAAAHVGSELTYVERGVLQVSLDPLAVEQILDNLLLNALRYGGGRPVIITADGKDRHVTLVVRDHGAGISQSDRERIFARFEQAVSSPSQGGFGIGLWVVGQLVQAMGGEIEVDTALNEGSSFKVTLPRVISQDR